MEIRRVIFETGPSDKVWLFRNVSQIVVEPTCSGLVQLTIESKKPGVRARL